MQVKKSSGEMVPYDPNKVRESLRRSGAAEHVVEQVVKAIEPKIKDGMTTAKLFHIVQDELKKQSTCLACRYGLRDALFKLGPAGFKFELYVASILRAYDYTAEVPEQELHGVCVDHEVDVVAVKDKRRVFIEAKFRNDTRGYVNLKDTMATWARFLDLVDASRAGKGPAFDECWIVTNARFSDRSRAWGACKGMRLVGWRYPQEHSFEQMVDHNVLYPLTVLDDMSQSELEAFSGKGVMLCKEVVGANPERLAEETNLPAKRVQTIIQQCQDVIATP